MSVLGDHGSHEDVIRIGGEVWSDNSLILTVGSAILNGLPSVVDWALIDDLVGVDANVGFLIIGLRVRGLGIGLDLNGALVWWSGVGSFGGVVSIILLENRVISVSEDGAELEDNLILTVELNGRLVWWSGVGLIGGVVTIGLLDG
jgi:hypothetical protein